MKKLAGRLRQQFWLMLALVGGSLAIALPGHTGSVPTGQGSGVTVGGTSILPLGASSLGSEELFESTTPNATVDPASGEVLLTATSQQSLNQSATEISRGLQSSNPVLAVTLATSGEIALDSSSSVLIASGAEDCVGDGENRGGIEECEDEVGGIVSEVAAAAADSILNGESVSLISSQGTLGIAAPASATSFVPEVQVASSEGIAIAQADSEIVRTSAVFAPVNGTPVVLPLRGTQEQIANAAGFLAASFAAGLTPNQVATFSEIALVGVDYADLVPLFNAVSGLLPAQPQAAAVSVDANQLEASIQAYNSVVDNTDTDALVALSESQDFVALGRSLEQLRAAIDI
ncbi:MAG: hypothetical protein WBG38_06505 [Nodosilinea sp.]